MILIDRNTFVRLQSLYFPPRLSPFALWLLEVFSVCSCLCFSDSQRSLESSAPETHAVLRRTGCCLEKPRPPSWNQSQQTTGGGEGRGGEGKGGPNSLQTLTAGLTDSVGCQYEVTFRHFLRFRFQDSMMFIFNF